LEEYLLCDLCFLVVGFSVPAFVIVDAVEDAKINYDDV